MTASFIDGDTQILSGNALLLERRRSTLPDNDLAQLQNAIDEQLDKVRIGWIRLATADFGLSERTAIRDGITSNEALLMALLERKWALRTTLFGSIATGGL